MDEAFILRLMRAGILLLAGSMAITVAAEAQKASGRVAHLELKANVKSEKVRVGEPIWIIFHLKNVSQEEVSVLMTRPEYDIALTVVDDSNRTVSITKLGEAHRDGIRVISGRTQLLRPGDECTFDIDVSELYDLKQPGKYYFTGAYSNRTMPVESKAPVTATRISLVVGD